MLTRICDRCGVPTAKPLDLASTTRSLVIPLGDPASNPKGVLGDTGVDLGIQVTQDLCGPCLASALLGYAIARFIPNTLTPADVQTILARITTAATPAKSA